MAKTKRGMVYLVGAGPGDPELITVKGLKALKSADVVLYDRLVNIELLKGLCAETYFVGKKKNIHYCTQDEINRLMVRFASAGKTVVRLKGGDPLVFGRGGEEMAALIKSGIDFSVIPGLTSSTAVASSIGLPLTHRDLSSSFAIVTGHRKKGKSAAAIPKADTIVFLMGLSALPKIIEDLKREGYGPESRIAVISKGTMKGERYVSGRIDEICEKVKLVKISSPAVVVFGKVVNWYDELLRSKEKCRISPILDDIISVYT